MSFLKKTGSAIKSGAEKTGSAIKGGAEKTGSAIVSGGKKTGSRTGKGFMKPSIIGATITAGGQGGGLGVSGDIANTIIQNRNKIKRGGSSTIKGVSKSGKSVASDISRGANVVKHQALNPAVKGVGEAVEIGITNPAQAVYHYEKERFERARANKDLRAEDVIFASADVPYVASQVGYLFGMKVGGKDEGMVRRITNSALPFMPYGSGYAMMGLNYTGQYKDPDRSSLSKSDAEKKQLRKREKRGSKNPDKKTGFGGNSRNDGSIPIYLA
jgi:hypothetical protein